LGNTVLGISEREFCAVWIQKLWQAMAKTGRGYRRPSNARINSIHVAGAIRPVRRDNLSKLQRRLARRCQIA
jgi:hypothetical protein